MGACTETRHYSRGSDHRIDRVCVLRAVLASGPGLAETSARHEMSRIRDSVSFAGITARCVTHSYENHQRQNLQRWTLHLHLTEFNRQILVVEQLTKQIAQRIRG